MPIVALFNVDHPFDASPGLSMIVLCSNPACGAVLRAASVDTPVTAVLLEDAPGRFFVCPRCYRRNVVRVVSGDLPLDEGPQAQPPAMT